MRSARVDALIVSDTAVIPIDCSRFALPGTNQLLKTIAAINRFPASQVATVAPHANVASPADVERYVV
ncbi:MAG: AAA family ATPase [Acidobacteriia bacterium]|nr:AAA family ATPase [Terriglobia bacterium]